jgi:hypothetical protein
MVLTTLVAWVLPGLLAVTGATATAGKAPSGLAHSDYATRAGFYRNPKDRLENALRRMVCRGALTLARAQQLIAGNWPANYRQLRIV